MYRILFISLLICFSIILKAQVSVTITSCTAGALSSRLTSGEKSSVTSLTITGTIDARDFKTMRDELPLLANVDLSGTSIVAYTGTNGTLSYSYDFLANQVPTCAFYESGSNNYNTTLSSVMLPETVTIIGGSAFRQCSNLSQINLPSGLIQIYSWAFSYMGQNIAISIPATTTNIPDDVFRAFRGTITVSPDNPNYSTHEGVFYNKGQTVLLNCPTTKTGSYTIPSTVSEIKTYAFASCNLLNGTVTVPPSVTKIKQYTFRDCSSLEQVVFPNTLTELEGNIFWNCSTLYSINIPALATISGNGVFINCTNLQHIYLGSSTPIDLSTRTNVFQNVNKSRCVLHVPEGSISAYKNAVEWQDFGFIKTPTRSARTVINVAGNLSNVITTIFRTEITDLYLSGTIDARDFKTMRDSIPFLENIDLSNADIVAYFGTKGTQTDISDYTANAVPYYAFYNRDISLAKTTLASIILPTSATSIEWTAFLYCSNLANIVLPEALTNISASAFYYCGNSLNITIPKTVTSITNSAFIGFNGYISVDDENPNYKSENGVLFNKSMTTLMNCPVTQTGNYIIPKTVTRINTSAFENCSLIEGTVDIPNGVTYIGINAFVQCSGLTGISIPSTVTSIGFQAFADCSNLAEIYSFPSTPVDLSTTTDVFKYVDQANCKLYVPIGSSAAYGSANQWSDFTSIIEIDGIRLSGNKRSVSANQNSTTTVGLFAYVPWIITSDQDWLFCHPFSGDYNATLNISVDANTTNQSRIGRLTISATGHPSRTITVTQNAGPGVAILNDLEIQNRTFADQTNKCFGAYNNITLAGNGTNVVFQNGSTATLIAGQSIRFLPGFHAQNGSQMNAWITTNSTFCDGVPAPIVSQPEHKSITQQEMPNVNLTIDKSIKVYPNPNNGQFTVELANFENATQIMIYNPIGQRIYNTTVTGQQHLVLLPDLQRGIYFLKAIHNEKQFDKKILVK